MSKLTQFQSNLSKKIISLGINIQPNLTNPLNSYSFIEDEKTISDFILESNNEFHREFSVFTGTTGCGKSVGLNERLISKLNSSSSKVTYFAMLNRSGAFFDKNIRSKSASTSGQYFQSILGEGEQAFVVNILDKNNGCLDDISDSLGSILGVEFHSKRVRHLLDSIYSEEFARKHGKLINLNDDKVSCPLLCSLIRINNEVELISADDNYTAHEIRNIALKKVYELPLDDIDSNIARQYREIAQIAYYLSMPTLEDFAIAFEEQGYEDSLVVSKRIKDFVGRYPFVSKPTNFYHFNNRVLGFCLNTQKDMSKNDASLLAVLALATMRVFTNNCFNRPLVILDDLYLLDKSIMELALGMFVKHPYTSKHGQSSNDANDVVLATDTLANLVIKDKDNSFKYINEVSQFYIGRLYIDAYENYLFRKFCIMGLLNDHETESLITSYFFDSLMSGEFFIFIRLKSEPSLINAKRVVEYIS